VDTAGRGWSEERSTQDPSARNPGNAERVVAEVRRLIARGVNAADVAVITPYDAQVRALRLALASERAAGLEIDTVDAFQGREKEAVVVDLVRSNDEGDLGFLNDVRRMNVALTRAKRFLLVIGDSATLGDHPYYAAFMETAEAQGAWTSAWDEPDAG
jgi:superfamily I DNA and/or RNA helicase